ncbi:hypothetical protein MMC30_002321 [Trapelia coarctata]|nr:hypothetical protein [Trapelia coarctata]
MPSADSPVRPGDPALEPLKTSKPFSISLSSKTKTSTTLPAKSSLNSRKRPHSSLAEGSDSDEDGRRNQTSQLVSAFDHSAGGAISVGNPKPVKQPLVIQAQKNKNWREESGRKRGKNLLPAEEQAARQGKVIEGNEGIGGEEETYGLTIVKRKDENGDVSMVDAKEVVTVEKEVRTVDEEALEALLEGKKKSDLILPAIRNGNDFDTRFAGRADEEDDFKTDIASRPDSASLDDYAAVPIEEFGAALLRGMGWKEGDVVGKNKGQSSKPRLVERRPALLGIGAKEVPDGLEELGAWGKGAKKKNMYTKGLAPVLLKNSVTGEMLTEEELKVKKEKEQMVEVDWRDRRDRNLRIDEDKKTERGYREKDRSHHSSRHSSSSRRDRDRSSERSGSRNERHRDERRHRGDHDDGGRSRSRSSRHGERDHYDDTRSRKRTEVY